MPELDQFRAAIEESFPGLGGGTQWEVTSPPDRSYNCLAWALDVNLGWYGPSPIIGFDWPEGVRRENDDIDSITALFESRGLVRTTEEAEAQVAVFQNGIGEWHVARRLDGDMWSSKLGEHADIAHPLRAIEGEVYGPIVRLFGQPEVVTTR